MRGYRRCSSGLSARPPARHSGSREASIPAASASTTASAITAWPQPTINWLSILVERPAPAGPMWVKRPAISANSGRVRSISAASPPAITVSVPVPEAGGPPETGASIQPAPVISRSRRANVLHLSTLMVEKSITSCGGRSAEATPFSPNTAASTASVVGRLSRTRSAPRTASAGDEAAAAPAARAAATLAAAMSYARTA